MVVLPFGHHDEVSGNSNLCIELLLLLEEIQSVLNNLIFVTHSSPSDSLGLKPNFHFLMLIPENGVLDLLCDGISRCTLISTLCGYAVWTFYRAMVKQGSFSLRPSRVLDICSGLVNNIYLVQWCVSLSLFW